MRSSRHDEVIVAVSDECGGIAEHDLQRVFDLTHRDGTARPHTDVAVEQTSGGGGLGPSIAKGFVEAHHGIIAVRNEGVGCTFTVCVPRSKPRAVAGD